jgi:hypothetical protein
VTFGIWDILYYAWLRVFLGWPPSPLTWNILFLIPVPWIGPVLAAVIVGLGLICGALWLLHLRSRGTRIGFAPVHWALASAGGMAVLVSFMLDWRVAFQGDEPPPFRWGLFGCGVAMGIAALIMGVRTMQRS